MPERASLMMVLGGLIPALELKGLLAVLAFPDEGQGLYNTLVGLLLADRRHLPAPGDKVFCGE